MFDVISAPAPRAAIVALPENSPADDIRVTVVTVIYVGESGKVQSRQFGGRLSSDLTDNIATEREAMRFADDLHAARSVVVGVIIGEESLSYGDSVGTL